MLFNAVAAIGVAYSLFETFGTYSVLLAAWVFVSLSFIDDDD